MSNPASNPAPAVDAQGDNRWMSLHNAYLVESKEREPEVVLLGDSIFLQLQQTDIWKEMFEPLHCLNFSIGGDQTQHLLWRLINGEMDDVKPKVIAVLIGANNHDHTSQQVSEAILDIVNTLSTRQPKSEIIVVGLLPRGEHSNPLREKHKRVNVAVEEGLRRVPNATFFDVDSSLFVSSAGGISRSDMYDFLHLTQDGYRKLCEPLLEEIQSLLMSFHKVECTSVGTLSAGGQLATDPS